jgi:hypothetical protein
VGAGCSRQGLLAQDWAQHQEVRSTWQLLAATSLKMKMHPCVLIVAHHPYQLAARTFGASAASALPLPLALGLAARSGRAGLRDLPRPAGLRLLVALRLAAGLALRLPLALPLPAGLRDLDFEPLEVLPELLQTSQGALDDAFMPQAARRCRRTVQQAVRACVALCAPEDKCLKPCWELLSCWSPGGALCVSEQQIVLIHGVRCNLTDVMCAEWVQHGNLVTRTTAFH